VLDPKFHRTPEIGFHTIGRHRLRIAHWRARTGSPGRSAAPGRPLLFFNGIGGSIELLTPFVGLLEGRDVVTFDPPGIGGSERPRWPYRPRNVAAAGDRIMREFGFTGEIDVMGASWGGMMAQQFAHQFPDRTRSLVLAATTAGALMIPGKLSALKEMARPRRHVDPSYMVRHKHELYGGRTDGLAAFWAQTLPPTRLGYWLQILAISGWTSAWFLPFMKARTLILAGADDNLVPLGNAKLLKQLIPNAGLHVIDDGGHLFLLTHRERMAREVERFLDEG
jgi:poly(3-hydroxyalkanoate) depolymerase